MDDPSIFAERFQTSIANICMHIRSIYKAGELSEESTIKLDLKVQKEGSRTVKRALKNTHSSKERKWFGAACISRVFAHNFSGLIARSWSTEAQGNIPAFYSYGTEREEDMEHLRRRRRGFSAGRSPFSPIGRRFRVP